MGGSSETMIEKIAGSSKLDKWAAIVICVIVIAQVVGLSFGVDLLKSIPIEVLLTLFGLGAAARRALVNGKGVRERSVDDLPIPSYLSSPPIPYSILDDVTEPIDIPINMPVMSPESNQDIKPGGES